MIDPVQRGRELREQDKDAEALQVLRQAVAQFPQSLDAWVMFSQCSIALSHMQEALQASDRALAIDPRSVSALACKVRALCGLQRVEEAPPICEQALAIDPNSPPALVAKSKVLATLGQFDAALALLDRVLGQNLLYMDAIAQKSGILMQMGRSQEALMVARGAYNAKPQSVFAQTVYGLGLLGVHQFDEAMKMAEMGITTSPTDPRPWTLKGAIYSERGQMRQSKDAWARAAQLDPTDASLQEEARAVAREHRGRVAKGALGFLGRAIGNMIDS